MTKNIEIQLKQVETSVDKTFTEILTAIDEYMAAAGLCANRDWLRSQQRKLSCKITMLA